MNVNAVFCGNLRRILRRDADDVLHLGLDLSRTGRGQVDFVDDRQDFQAGIDGQIGVGQGLGLHALGRIHHQHRALAGRQGAADLVVEVHVARGVNQVQGVGFPIIGGVGQGRRRGLDGDATLLFQLHGVQHLLLHLPGFHGVTFLQQPVCQSGLAMVNMGDNRKITNLGKLGHKNTSSIVSLRTSDRCRWGGNPPKF